MNHIVREKLWPKLKLIVDIDFRMNSTALLFCFAGALCTEHFGFSLALGAFLAGILIADSDYAHQIMADISPFKDVFLSIFFISLGMLIDVGVIKEHFLTK